MGSACSAAGANFRFPSGRNAKKSVAPQQLPVETEEPRTEPAKEETKPEEAAETSEAAVKAGEDKPNSGQENGNNGRDISATSTVLPGTSVSLSQTVDDLPEVNEKPLPDLDEFPEPVRLLLMGRTSEKTLPNMPSKDIYLFVAGDTKDTAAVRMAMAEQVFPGVRLRCLKDGYTFNVVDLHVPLEDSRIPYSQMADLRATAFRDLLKLENLLVLVVIGTSFSPPWPPSRMSVADFDSAVSNADSGEEREIFHSSYSLDKNAIPPCYLLNDSDRTAYTDTEASVLVHMLERALEHDSRQRCIRSEIEEDLTFCLSFLKTAPKGSCLLVNTSRLLNDSNDDSASTTTSRMQGRIQSLIELIEEQVPGDCKINFYQDNNKQHKRQRQFEDLCFRVTSKLLTMAETIMEKEEEIAEFRPYPGVHRQLYEELVCQHGEMLSRFSVYHNMRPAVLKSLWEYLTGSEKHPLILHGTEGAGKTSVMCAAAYLAGSSWFPSSTAVVTRIASVSTESMTQDSILRSIIEQCCYLYGEHYSLASRSRTENCLEVLFSRVSIDRPLIILLDGLDQVQVYSCRCARWLPTVLLDNVKIVVSVEDSCKEMEELKDMFAETKSAFLKLPDLRTEESLSLMSGILFRKKRTLSELQMNAVRFCVADNPFPRYVQILAHVAASWQSSEAPTTANHDLESWVFEILDAVSDQVGRRFLKRTIMLLCSTKYGLSDFEVVSLLSNFGSGCLSDSEGTLQCFVLMLWLFLKFRLSPFFHVTCRHGNAVIHWSCNAYRKLCQMYCRDEPRTEIHKTLLRFFQGKFIADDSLQEEEEEDDAEETEEENCCTLLCRQLEELTYLCMVQDVPVRSRLFMNPQWLRLRISSGDTHDVLEDIKLYRRKNPDDHEFNILREVIQLSSYALRCSGEQLYSHLYGRLRRYFLIPENRTRYPSVTALYRKSVSPIAPSLLPSNRSIVELTEASRIPRSSPAISNAPSVTDVAWFSGKPNRLVTFHAEAEEVVLWDVQRLKDILISTEMSPAQGIKVLDSHRLIIIGRDYLEVYDVSRGSAAARTADAVDVTQGLFTTREGKYLLAVSSTRTEVLKISAQNGKTEARMSAGEDRYLCNLCVSENGEVCICGDDLQKPYPLVVWDVRDSKLRHEFRMPHHEFLTRMSSMDRDGRHYATAAKDLLDSSPNFLVLYDSRENALLWSRKTGFSVNAVGICSEASCVVSATDNALVCVWNLDDGTKRFILSKHGSPADSVQISKHRSMCLTFDSKQCDRTLHLWNLSSGKHVAAFTADEMITCCALSSDGTAIAIGMRNRKQPDALYLCHSSPVFEDKIS